MFLLEESIKLLWKVLEEGKANKEHLNNQQREFLKVASKAVRRTLSYIGEDKKDTKTEKELSELWANVAVAAQSFDPDLAERCYLKGNYWANPNSWSNEEINKAGIEIERVDIEIRKYFKGKTSENKIKQQKAIGKKARLLNEKFPNSKNGISEDGEGNESFYQTNTFKGAIIALVVALLGGGIPAWLSLAHKNRNELSKNTHVSSEAKTSGDTSPAIITSGPNSPVTVNYNSSEPKTKQISKSKLDLSPEKIYEEIKSRPVFQQKDAKKYYIGSKVNWPLYLNSIEMLDEKTAWLFMGTQKSLVMISCSVEILRYPQLKTLKGDSVIWVSGEIETVDKSLINLTNVSLEFE